MYESFFFGLDKKLEKRGRERDREKERKREDLPYYYDDDEDDVFFFTRNIRQGMHKTAKRSALMERV